MGLAFSGWLRSWLGACYVRCWMGTRLRCAASHLADALPTVGKIDRVVAAALLNQSGGTNVGQGLGAVNPTYQFYLIGGRSNSTKTPCFVGFLAPKVFFIFFPKLSTMPPSRIFSAVLGKVWRRYLLLFRHCKCDDATRCDTGTGWGWGCGTGCDGAVVTVRTQTTYARARGQINNAHTDHPNA